MKIKIEIDIDARRLAEKLESCPPYDLEERVCNLVIDETIEDIKYCDGIDWSEFKKVIDEVRNWKFVLFGNNKTEEYDGYDGQ